MSATALARRVVDGLLRRGLQHAVAAPGSRNAPLLLALAEAADAGALTLHTRVDERTAGFLALGLAKTSRRPVAVVTTSGTAAAHLHAAVLEAAHSAVPLVAVTADRPARLRGTLANQTTDQVGLFGEAAPWLDASQETDPAALEQLWSGLAVGPVHLNVQLDEPLLPTDPYAPTPAPRVEPLTSEGSVLTLQPGPRTVVVAGDDAGPGARTLAERGAWPLLAEPSSGSRNGANPIRTYRLLLETPLSERIERVVVVGSPTLSRPVQRLLARPGLDVVARTQPGRWRDRPHPVTQVHDGPLEAAAADDPAWLEAWRAADAALSARLDALVTGGEVLTPYDVAAAVNAALPAGGLLHVGASNPIRDLDLMARPYPVGERRMVIANRGLAGIDGTLSTAIGAVLGRPHSTRSIAYLGDVTFLHDLTGLVIGPDEQRPDLTIVVANDDGGSIFATLEQGASAYSRSFEKVFGTPHGADLAALCAGLGVPHRRVTTRAALDTALASPPGGLDVVEATITRTDRRAVDAAIRELQVSPVVQ